jgi:hypothetical protein
MAIVARSDTAKVKRARFAFTGTYLVVVRLSIITGGRAVSRGRSLALRRRLTTGLPWTMAIEWNDLRSVLKEWPDHGPLTMAR